ncbi:SulP family inorganic anion transporter [Streptomyces aureus]|uniref:SulP family inorganic anion transporter n=1 Tax=Streptomyces aureus TaxID=193461 RepID=UPI00360A37DA
MIRTSSTARVEFVELCGQLRDDGHSGSARSPGGDPGHYASLAAALAVTVGLLCLAARAVRLGFLADLRSRPVLISCLAGVALIMAVDQSGSWVCDRATPDVPAGRPRGRTTRPGRPAGRRTGHHCGR